MYLETYYMYILNYILYYCKCYDMSTVHVYTVCIWNICGHIYSITLFFVMWCGS